MASLVINCEGYTMDENNNEAIVSGKARRLNPLGGGLYEVTTFVNPNDRPIINGEPIEIDGKAIIYRGV